jgi:hypothetical protein
VLPCAADFRLESVELFPFLADDPAGLSLSEEAILPDATLESSPRALGLRKLELPSVRLPGISAAVKLTLRPAFGGELVTGGEPTSPTPARSLLLLNLFFALPTVAVNTGSRQLAPFRGMIQYD